MTSHRAVEFLRRFLTAAILVIAFLSAAAASSEAEDFKAISELLDLGVTRSALNRCKVYLSRYPEGAHRSQVAAWGGALLLRAGNPADALVMLQEALGGTVENADGVRLDLAEALLDVGKPAEALGVLQEIRPSQESEQERLIELTGKVKVALAESEGKPAPPEAERPEAKAAAPIKPKAPGESPVPKAEGASSRPAEPEGSVRPSTPPQAAHTEAQAAAPATPRAAVESPVPKSEVAAPRSIVPAAPVGHPAPEKKPPSATETETTPLLTVQEGRPAGPAEGRVQEALGLAEKGHDEEAVALFRKFLAEGSADPAAVREARLGMGASLYRLGRFDQSLLALAPLTTAKAPDTPALLLSAWDLHRTGQDRKAYDAARKASPLTGWKEASELEPIRLAAVEREHETVVAGAQEVLKSFPEGPTAVRALLLAAAAYEQAGQGAAALRVLEAALPQMPAGRAQCEAALKAALLAWDGSRDAKRASRWFTLAAQSASDDAARARVKLSRARVDWERGESTDALQALAEVIKLYPNTPAMAEAYLLLGQMQIAEGDREKGLDALKVVTGSFPNAPSYPEAALMQAEVLLAGGLTTEATAAAKTLDGRALSPALDARRMSLEARLCEARGECGKMAAWLAQAAALQGGPGDTELFATLACGLRAGHIAESIEAAESLKDPTLVTALRFRAAEALEAAGKGAEARVLWADLAAQGGPDGALALWCLADGQITAGLAEEGIASLKTLAAYGPDEPLSCLAQYRLEKAYLDRGNPGAALESIAAFRRAEPPRAGEAEALLASAREKSRAGNATAAREFYQAYMDRFPNKPGAPEASLALAKDSMARGDWAGARKLLEGCVPTPARDLLLAQVCLKLGDLEAAQAAAGWALASPLDLGPDAVCQADLVAAEAAAGRGNTAEAATRYAEYAQYVKASRSDRDSLMDVALFLQEQGQFDAALAAFEKLDKLGRDPAVAFQYAYTLELAGRKEEALKAFLKAAKSPSPMWAPTARYRAAELYADLGQLKEAIAIYKDMAVSAKGTVQGDFSKQRLQELEEELAESQPPAKKPAAEKAGARKPTSMGEVQKPASKGKPAAKKSASTTKKGTKPAPKEEP